MVGDRSLNLRDRLLYWAAKHPYAAVLDSCGSEADRYGKYEWLVAVAREPRLFRSWEALEAAPNAWKFGFLSYELKNEFEPGLPRTEAASVSVPDINFFVPETVLALKRGCKDWEVLKGDAERVEGELARVEAPENENVLLGEPEARISREDYLDKVDRIRTHIRDGDVYELNFCQEFRVKGELPAPELLFRDLREVSPTPFACFLRMQDVFVLGASPERFLSLEGDRLLTQPIKGTIRRGKDPEEDAALVSQLHSSEKERAENVMIVDLSRNDLYRSAETDSVSVPHLFEVQTFAQVHHLVSSVTGRKKKSVSALQAIRNTFPPGSMTGAPKVRSMELISELEGKGRGIYAGSVGYFDPSGNFDLNVVIRSLIYDRSRDLLSWHVGGAITYDSDPEKEFHETLLKAAAIRRIL